MISPASTSRSKHQWNWFPWERQRKEREEARAKRKRLPGSPQAPGLRKEILCTLPLTLRVCTEPLTSETAHPDGLPGATEGQHCLGKWRREEGKQVLAGLWCKEGAGRRGRFQGSQRYSKDLE